MKLESPGVAKAVAKRLLEDIDNYCLTYDGGHRNHLGASQIGKECKRQLWFIFRWCFREPTDGRRQRLFNRGHREEERFLEWLRAIGCEVSDVTEDGHQHRISDCNGHFGGSLDGKGYLPKSYDIEEQVLFEFKTNKTGTGFNNLCKKSMILTKEEHYAQTCTYGFKENLNYSVYLNINKNDDSLHIEVVKLDHKLGEHMIAKAEQIIYSQEAPARISDNPTFHKCRYLCQFTAGCHGCTMPVEKNCRSCKNCFPVENAEWFCKHYNAVIPQEFIKVGCNDWDKIY